VLYEYVLFQIRGKHVPKFLLMLARSVADSAKLIAGPVG